MNYKLIPTKVFEKELKGLNKKYPSLKTDLKVVVEKIVANPRYGTPLGFDCFKIRLLIRSKGRGKSGGARLITCIKIKDKTVFLISIYDKAEQETISEKKLIYYLKLSGLI